MGSTADLCGVKTASAKKTKPKTKGLVEQLKVAYTDAYNRGYEDQVRRLQFLLANSGVKLAEDMMPPEELLPQDDVAEEELSEEAVADEVADQDQLADQLIEKLLETIEDPTVASDDDREAVLESSNTFEDEELKEGQKTASVSELLEARLQNYYKLFGQEG